MLYLLCFGLAILSWIVAELSGYSMHAIMHWMGHSGHGVHHSLYPVDDYRAKEYRSPGRVAGFKQDFMYSIPALVWIGVVFVLWGFYAALIPLSVILVYAYVTQYVHNAFHVQGHWLERYDWFWNLVALHYCHHFTHVDMNFGIISLFWDRVFGSRLKLHESYEKTLFRQWGRIEEGVVSVEK